MIGLVFIGVSAFAFFGILAGILLHKILGMYMDGEISGGVCLLMAGGFLTIVGALIIVPSTDVRIMLALFLIGCVTLVPYLRERVFIQGANRKIDREKLQKYYDAIEADPTNLAARTRFAETLYKLGHLNEAIEQMAYVVEVSPKSDAERHTLKYWMREQEERKAPPVRCPSCGQSNDPTRVRCAHCESELSARKEVVKWLKKGALKQIAITSGITMGVISVIMVTLTMLSFPIRIGIIALILIIVICAEFWYWQHNLSM